VTLFNAQSAPSTLLRKPAGREANEEQCVRLDGGSSADDHAVSFVVSITPPRVALSGNSRSVAYTDRPASHVASSELGMDSSTNVADQNIGIEPDHRGFRRISQSAAPAAMASFISSIDTRLRRALTMPRSAEAGSLGKITTLPSGWIKNFTRSPGFSCR